MKFTGITGNFTEATADAIAVAVFKGEKPTDATLKELDKMTGGIISSLIKAEEFKGDANETALIRFVPKGTVKASRLLLVGVGTKADYQAHAICKLAGTATRFLRKRSIKSFALIPRSEASASEVAQQSVQGFITSQFELDKYKTKDKEDKQVTGLIICIPDAKPADLKAGIARGQSIGESINFTRDLEIGRAHV